MVDVPPKPAARVRLLDNDHSDKRRWCCTWSETDTHDARSTAIVALRNARLRQVTLEDHTAVLRLFARRHHGIRDAVGASGTTLTELYGVGPVVAGYVLGYSGDICRFPSAGHYPATTRPPRSKPPAPQ